MTITNAINTTTTTILLIIIMMITKKPLDFWAIADL